MKAILSLIILSLIILMFFFPVTHAEIFVCEKGCDFSSIQDAIDSASEGDRIVAEGFFFENLNITKSIILTGNATLYPTGTKAGVSISSDNVEVSGLIVKGGITGIEVVGSEGVKIENCKFTRNFYGLLLEESSYCTIKGNNFENVNDSAIRLVNSELNILLSNHIDGSTVAVYFLQSSGNNLNESSFVNVKAGVVLEGSLDNNITGNEISADTAIFMYQSGRNRISDNTANGSVFVRLLFSSKNTIEQNEAEGTYTNFDSYKNEFAMKNLKLTGEEFQFSIEGPAFEKLILPHGFVPLSSALNITIIPNLITQTGYVEFEASIPPDDLNISTVGIYRLDGMERLSESYYDEEMIKTNFTTNKSGVYLLAGKVEQAPPPGLQTPTQTSTPTSTPILTPLQKWIPGFESLFAVAGMLLALILRRRGAK